MLIVAAGVSVSVLGQPAPRAGCEWEYDPELHEWVCIPITDPAPTATPTPKPATATPTPRRATATPTPTPSSRGWLRASATTIDVGESTTVTAEWQPAGLATWLGIASDSTAVLWRSSQCSGTRFVEPPSEASLTVYGCEGGTGTVELRAVRSTGRLLASITITVRTPPTPTATPTDTPVSPTPTPTPAVAPSGELSATRTSIDVDETVTVNAVNVSPSGQRVYITTNGQLDYAHHGSCHMETGPRSSERAARSWNLIGCSPPGSGSVSLKTRHNGRTLLLDTITIDVEPAPTATPTPTPTPAVAPSGELSATRTSIDVDETVTVNAVNVSPSSQSVYITTNGQLDYAHHGSCHVETGPRSSERAARSWNLIGCSPPGSGSVSLKTRHNGRTLLLDTITIDVEPAPTATPTPTPMPTVTPSGELTATRTSIDVDESTTVTAEWEPPGLSTWLGFATDSTAVLGRSSQCSGTRSVDPPQEASLTVYGCQGGSGTVELRANGSTGTLLDSIVITVNPPTPTSTPPAVSNLTTTASPTSVRLSWKKLDGATKYRVEHRLATSTDAWTRVDTTAYARNVTNLVPDTSYAFKIRAYGDGVTYVADWGAEAATTVSTLDTEDTVAPVKPPAPGSPNASASGEDSVSVSWTALTGADKYAVRYRQGSSGNWDTDEDNITGTSHPVDDLDCDTGYQFSVRAYGDGLTYLAAWGAWSSASSEVRTSTCPTPTPTPTPGSGGPLPAPSGTLSASPEKIAVGQSTTITATWNNVASTPKLSFGPQLAERCAGVGGKGVQGRSVLDTELVAKATQTLTGCTAGTVTVKLLDGSTELDAVTVAVVAKPNIEATRRIGYRWFNIGWTAARSYTSFGVEWRNEGDGESDWSELVTSGQSGARAIMSGMAAAIRGLPHEDKRIEIRVIARGSGGLEGRSDTLRYARDTQPAARGHLPDHTMVYQNVMGTAGGPAVIRLVNMVTDARLSSAAAAWSNAVPSLDLKACATRCADDTRNKDGERFLIEKTTSSEGCGGAPACVKGLPDYYLDLELEGRIVGTGLKMLFAPDGARGSNHEWTTIQSLDLDETPDGTGRYIWIDRVMVHEFGHTFGLADRYKLGSHPDPTYYGVMGNLGCETDLDAPQCQAGEKAPKAHDIAALKAIYETHTRNEGW